MSTDSFLVIDTEGFPLLHEVAIINSRGEVIYEAFTPNSKNRDSNELNKIKPLKIILNEIKSLVKQNHLIAHNGSHDRVVLKKSYAEVGLKYPDWKIECTYQLARSLFPNLENHGLEYLAKEFELGPKKFSSDKAHVATYDAYYTYYLYRLLQREQNRQILKDKPNPFGSTRVDTPFQKFSDACNIYGSEYKHLRAILEEISQDLQHQSKGIVVVGEAGAGKTHLMMRLAQDILNINRVFFIRQPNHPDIVNYHIYLRILESLVETVDADGKNQLDLLLIRSILSIFITIPNADRTQLDRAIIEALEAESLDKMGREGTEAKRKYWLRIEQRVMDWWSHKYSIAGYRRQILQGILRQCRYSDPNRRDLCLRWLSNGTLTTEESEKIGLIPWDDNIQREEFSLQAIQILGELSCLDQPLIIVFDQLEGLWLEGNRPILLKFGEALKELFTHVPNSLIITTLFPDRWQQFQQDFDNSIVGRVAQKLLPLTKPSSEQLEEIINLRLNSINTNASEIFTDEERDKITQQSSIRNSLNCAHDLYAYQIQDIPLPSWSEVTDQKQENYQINSSQRLQLVEKKLDDLLDAIQFLTNIRVKDGEPLAQDLEQKIEAISGLTISNKRQVEEKLQKFLTSEIDALNWRFHKPQIFSDEDDIGKFRQICQTFQCIKSFQLERPLRLGSRKLPEHILIKNEQGFQCIGFLNKQNSSSIGARLKNFNQLVLQNNEIQFILIRDATIGYISTVTASQELNRFRNARLHTSCKTHFQILKADQRLQFELAYRFVNALINRDLEMPKADALEMFTKLQADNWVVRLIIQDVVFEDVPTEDMDYEIVFV